MDIISKAREFAANKHKGQKRKYSSDPYDCHLDAVVLTLRCHGVDDATILAAAYLHDTVEDTETTLQELVAGFGADIAELVYWLTDADEGSPEIKVLVLSWRLARAPFGAKIIKLADTSSITRRASVRTT